MELPEEIVVGKTTLTLAKSSCAVKTVDNAGKHLNAFCFVGENWEEGEAVEWFLSPLEGYEKKKLRVEETVVEEHVHNCGVFLRMGDFTFRQYQVKNESSDHLHADVCSKVIEEDTYDASLCNTPRSLYFLSRSTTQGGGGDTPLYTRGQYITMDNTDDGGENNNASQWLTLIPSPKAARELRGYEIIQEKEKEKEEEGNKPKKMRLRAESFLPPIVPPKKPPIQLEPSVKGSGSFRSRRLLSAQQNQKQ